MMILRPQGLLGIHELWETHAVRGLMRRFRPTPAVAAAKIPTPTAPKTGDGGAP